MPTPTRGLVHRRPGALVHAQWPARLANAVMDSRPGWRSLPDYGRRWRDRISGPTLLRVAVDAIVPNDDFAWSAFANEIAFLDPDDLDGSTAVARIVVVQYLSDLQHSMYPCAQ